MRLIISLIAVLAAFARVQAQQGNPECAKAETDAHQCHFDGFLKKLVNVTYPSAEMDILFKDTAACFCDAFSTFPDETTLVDKCTSWCKFHPYSIQRGPFANMISFLDAPFSAPTCPFDRNHKVDRRDFAAFKKACSQKAYNNILVAYDFMYATTTAQYLPPFVNATSHRESGNPDVPLLEPKQVSGSPASLGGGGFALLAMMGSGLAVLL
ncbi:hypothetical protein BC832DRAFT_81563 [Gaertneriomyces semiglobifer]|nr:hypothetical protein BC832DRAFT_81563 [Gaertneriomyces semiglobifer]